MQRLIEKTRAEIAAAFSGQRYRAALRALARSEAHG